MRSLVAVKDFIGILDVYYIILFQVLGKWRLVFEQEQTLKLLAMTKTTRLKNLLKYINIFFVEPPLPNAHLIF